MTTWIYCSLDIVLLNAKPRVVEDVKGIEETSLAEVKDADDGACHDASLDYDAHEMQEKRGIR